MKQTAVEWLVDKLKSQGLLIGDPNNLVAVREAKEMEKQQIIDAHGNQQKKSRGVSNYTYILTGEEYYKEEYER
jgi:hypothetical protein